MSADKFSGLIARVEGLTSGSAPSPSDSPYEKDALASARTSPVRSGSGRIRNLRAMGDSKFDALLDEMRPIAEQDPEGWKAVADEAKARGYLDHTSPERARKE